MMIRVVLLLSLLKQSLQDPIPKTAACKCTDLKFQGDCRSNLDCEWNTNNSTCQEKGKTAVTYCSTQESCPISGGCALEEKVCTHFTGCTAYAKKTDSECQAISTRCTSDGTICIDIFPQCQLYKTQIGCIRDRQNNYCYWNEELTQCEQAQSCDKLPKALKSDQECRKALSNCTASATGCEESGNDCKDQKQEGCFFNKSKSQTCFWDGQACKDKICINAPEGFGTITECSNFLSSCTLAEDGTGCMDLPNTCSELKTQAQCTKTNSQICYWEGAACKEWTCSAAPQTLVTHIQCYQFKASCTVSDLGKGCVSLQDTCVKYKSAAQCVETIGNSMCTWVGQVCLPRICDNAKLTNYTHETCKAYHASCTNDGQKCVERNCNVYTSAATCSVDYENKLCSWSGKCQIRTCENAQMVLINHKECSLWLTGCTIHQSGKGCVPQAKQCSLITLSEQCWEADNGKKTCIWFNNRCVEKTCASAPTDLVSDQDCQDFLPECTVAPSGLGCIKLSEQCSQYNNQIQCFRTPTTKCFWESSATPPICVSRSCTQAQYSTHEACKNFLTSCTVNSGGTQCENLKGQCSEYKSSGQCVETNTSPKKLCIWNQNSSPNVCEDRSCDNSAARSSHNECYNHLNTCTVNAAKNACVPLQAQCSSYLVIDNCVLTSTGGQCIWENNACQEKNCELAKPKLEQSRYLYVNHEDCQKFHPSCTTNSKGCVQLKKCTEIDNRHGCVIGTDGPCSFVPSCQPLKCEDAPTYYNTDRQCRAFLVTCTTNGSGCITRDACSTNFLEAACIVDKNGKRCAWVNQRCIDFGCQSAPSRLTTELECSLHLRGCTAGQQGGCIEKNRCFDAKTQAACTTDIDGNECEFSDTGCRNKLCSDFKLTTHKECSEKLSVCTTDGTMCVDQRKCSEKKTAAGCLLDNEGRPCLWVNGACYSYTECQSIKETTHEKCQAVSPKCTTDAINCIPIRPCAELQPLLNCYVGTDGICVQTPDAINGELKCKIYTDCTGIYFSSHKECWNANNQCTTDSTKCIPLQEKCEQYKEKAGCQINKSGQECNWNEKDNKCLDKVCKDIIVLGTDKPHEYCSQQLKICTKNEKNETVCSSVCTADESGCIEKQECKEYKDKVCNLAMGKEGRCIWDPSLSSGAQCRQRKCPDVDICTELEGCVDSGEGCVARQGCSEYKTEKGCRAGGTDGVCVWALDKGVGSCKVMTACADAKDSSETCYRKSWACIWSQSAQGTSTCGSHTCASKAKETGTCLPLLSFDEKSFDICVEQGTQQCIKLELAKLTSDTCYKGTDKTHRWDPDSQSCKACSSSSSNGSNNNGSVDPPTPQPSDQGAYKLISLVVLMTLLN